MSQVNIRTDVIISAEIVTAISNSIKVNHFTFILICVQELYLLILCLFLLASSYHHFFSHKGIQYNY